LYIASAGSYPDTNIVLSPIGSIQFPSNGTLYFWINFGHPFYLFTKSNNVKL
jgi:hypothetical protein